VATGSVDVVYRRVFRKTLTKNIRRDIVFAARKRGQVGIAFARYTELPERNGIRHTATGDMTTRRKDPIGFR
jgi:hypothetical protein